MPIVGNLFGIINFRDKANVGLVYLRGNGGNNKSVHTSGDYFFFRFIQEFLEE